MNVTGLCFRVRTPEFSTQWLPDTPSNRHLTIVWFQLLRGARQAPLRTVGVSPACGQCQR
jgi:hypothetical protein